jgi:hypothetical protein
MMFYELKKVVYIVAATSMLMETRNPGCSLRLNNTNASIIPPNYPEERVRVDAIDIGFGTSFAELVGHGFVPQQIPGHKLQMRTPERPDIDLSRDISASNVEFRRSIFW